MRAIIVLTGLTLVLSACLAGEGEPFEWRQKHDHASTAAERGFTNFLYFDFHALNGKGLENTVIPWKLATAALLFEKRVERQDATAELQKIFKANGFLFPKVIENAPQGKPVSYQESPLGMVRGMIDLKIEHTPLSDRFLPNVEGAVIGCATCHAGVAYDSQGRPQTDHIWLGIPNTSLNMEGFFGELTVALRNASSPENEAKFKRYIAALYPNAREAKHQIFLNSTLKEIRTRLSDKDSIGILPFHNGPPGNTNGVAALKNIFKLSDQRALAQETGVNSIPPIFDRQFRTSYLYDGVYKPRTRKERFWEVTVDGPKLSLDEIAKIVSFFSIPTMGNTETRAEASIGETVEILKFIEQANRPKWPANIDLTMAQAGHQVYQRSCAQCHGQYQFENGQAQLLSFPNRLVPVADIGTDPMRMLSVSKSVEQRTSHGIIAKYFVARNTGGYVAPLLTAISLTAPYLHNGSVPTLWQFMNPRLRVSSFLVGGHSLDLKQVGVKAEGIEATSYSRPVLYDTSRVGLSNRGHEFPFENLSAVEKWEVIEFLKTL